VYRTPPIARELMTSVVHLHHAARIELEQIKAAGEAR
jgi:hypothetical protein